MVIASGDNNDMFIPPEIYTTEPAYSQKLDGKFISSI